MSCIAPSSHHLTLTYEGAESNKSNAAAQNSHVVWFCNLFSQIISTLNTMVLLVPLPPLTLYAAISLWGSPVVSAFAANNNPSYSAEWINLSSSSSSSSSFPPPGIIEPPRSGAQTISCSGKILTFAGYAEEVVDDAVERDVVNDLWEFVPYHKDSVSWGWKQVIAAGECPGPRLAFAMAAMPSASNAYVIGGWDPMVPGTGGKILDDVSMLDGQTLKWSQPKSTDDSLSTTVPGGPTSRHVAVALSDDVICVHNHRCEDHVLLLHTNTDQNLVKWDHQKISGEAPSSRGLHCATTIGTSKTKNMVIFGGAAQDGRMSNEAFVLDSTTWKWTKINCEGEDAPAPRAGACLCALDDNSVLLFGGAMPSEGGLVGLNDVWVLHVNDGRWECLLQHQTVDNDRSSSTFPPGRNAATLTEIDAKNMLPDARAFGESRCYLLQGGWAPFRKTFNDVYVLRISSKE